MIRIVFLVLVLLSGAYAKEFTAAEIADKIQSAEQGEVKAQSDIGFLYYESKELPQNQEKALYWTRRAAEAGYGPAQTNLGYFYTIGFGVSKDIPQAIYWYEKAAKQDVPDANYSLGTLYYFGNGIDKNLELAATYFKKAARKDLVPALVALGGMYTNGEGVKKDGYEAIRQFRKAVELGDTQSQMDLGKIYLNGVGVPINFNEARGWFTKAAELGNKEAKAILKSLPALETRHRDDERRKNQSYVQNLRKKYTSRLQYRSDYARKVVQSFDLDCKAGDGRYLPLEHVLLSKLAAMDKEHAWLVTRADSRGEDVRIYDDLVSADGKVMNSTVAFELNKWGEIRSPSIRMEAVLNSCFGSYGPIWVVPTR